MKKMIKIFISVMISLFILILLVVKIDNKYDKNNYKIIMDKTDIKNISYVNRYGDYYIVLNDKYLYAINKEYKIVSEIDKILLYENSEKYDIIYDNELFMYLDDDGGKYRYYDIYSYKLAKEIDIGG